MSIEYVITMSYRWRMYVYLKDYNKKVYKKILHLPTQNKNELPASMNAEARESSKTEECAAICKLHGVAENAPLALQLKAIDQEYHQLLNNGQSGKADHVQALFAWKSKQATQVSA